MIFINPVKVLRILILTVKMKPDKGAVDHPLVLLSLPYKASEGKGGV